MPNTDSFLTVAEVAELLRLNPQTIRNWIDQGALPAVRVGTRRVRIRRSELDRFLNAGGGSTPTAGTEDVPLGTGAPATDLLSRQKLAQQLGRSLRWVDSRVKEGMPSKPPTAGSPHRRFVLDEVRAWLDRRAAGQPTDDAQDVENADAHDLARALRARSPLCGGKTGRRSSTRYGRSQRPPIGSPMGSSEAPRSELSSERPSQRSGWPSAQYLPVHALM